MTQVETKKNEAEHRYEAYLDHELAGSASYELDGEQIVFTHTEVDDRFGGKGVGSALIRFALDDVRADGGHRVVARCSFVRTWIEKHPEYEDLVGPASQG